MKAKICGMIEVDKISIAQNEDVTPRGMTLGFENGKVK